jgi:hypothetical protein
VRELNLPTAVHCMKGCDVVLQLSKAEIAFLDWLRTNGGEARLSSRSIQPGWWLTRREQPRGFGGDC